MASSESSSLSSSISSSTSPSPSPLDYGIKVSKPGFDVTDTPTKTNKKNYIVLDSADSHKLVYAAMVEATSYAHGLSYIPYFFAFSVDSAGSPTTFTRKLRGVTVDGTNIAGLNNPSYIMIFFNRDT